MFRFIVFSVVLFSSTSLFGQDRFTKEVIRLTNVERVAQTVVDGIPRPMLEYDERLDKAAQFWTDFLGDIDDFTHHVAIADYPEHDELMDLDIDGYCNFTDRVLYYGWLGPSSENIAILKSMSPQGTVWAWMNSPGHRSNLLNPNWTHAGVGKGPWNAGRNCCTMNFGQDLGD